MSWNNTSSSFIDVTRKWFFFSSEFKFVVLDWWSSIEYGAIKGPVRNWLSIESNDYRIHQCCDPLTPSGPTDLEHHVGGTPLASFFFLFRSSNSRSRRPSIALFSWWTAAMGSPAPVFFFILAPSFEFFPRSSDHTHTHTHQHQHLADRIDQQIVPGRLYEDVIELSAIS